MNQSSIRISFLFDSTRTSTSINTRVRICYCCHHYLCIVLYYIWFCLFPYHHPLFSVITITATTTTIAVCSIAVQCGPVPPFDGYYFGDRVMNRIGTIGTSHDWSSFLSLYYHNHRHCSMFNFGTVRTGPPTNGKQ